MYDHFNINNIVIFRYSSNLHQELAPAPTDSMYRTRGTPRGINPIEIPGLHAVLALIRTVAGKLFTRIIQSKTSLLRTHKGPKK
jgi:hypothetical protein